MNRPRPLAVLTCSLLLLAATGTAMAQGDGPDEDPFADDPGLFGEEDEEDPFAELEERANVDEDGSDASDEGDDETGQAADDEGDENSIPFPIVAALASLLLTARLTARREG